MDTGKELSTQRVQLVKVLNPFNSRHRQFETLDYSPTLTIRDIRENYYPKSWDVTITLHRKNQQPKILIKEEWDIQVELDDNIAIIPKLEGGQGTNILRTIAMIAVFVISMVLSAGSSAFVAAIIMAGVNITGGWLINMLLPPPKPAVPETTEQSNTYSWDVHTTQQQGLVIPKIYGTFKSMGNLVAWDVKYKDEEEKLKLLIEYGLRTNIRYK